jgi:hypothetical protein
MSLVYDEDFFANAPIVDDAVITVPQGFKIKAPGLAQLTKLFWHAKSYDWSVDIHYTIANSANSDSGEVAGSGTVLVETNFSASRGTGALPGERVVASIYFDNLPSGSGTGYWNPTATGAYDTVPPSTPTPYSEVKPVTAPAWFFAQFDPALNGGALVTRTGTDYFTRMQAQFVYGGAVTDTLTPDSTVGTDGLSGVTFTLKVDGYPDIVYPLYIIPGSGITSRTVTGTIVLNFNSFWMP